MSTTEKKYCVITCHGFTGYPQEMEPLGKYLEKKNFVWHNLTLPGHASSPEDLKNTKWRQWTDYVDKEVKECLERYDGVFFSGLSMGGIMTLYALENHPELMGGATMSAPLYIVNKIESLLLKLPIGFWMKRSDDDIADINDPEARKKHHAYDTFHTNSGKELNKLLKTVRNNLNKVKQPLLAIQSTKDQIVDYHNVNEILKRVSSETKRRLVVANSGHVLTKDYDKELIFFEIADFFKEIIDTRD